MAQRLYCLVCMDAANRVSARGRKWQVTWRGCGLISQCCGVARSIFEGGGKAPAKTRKQISSAKISATR